MLVDWHVNDLVASSSFNLFILANCHRDQLARCFKTIFRLSSHLELDNVVAIQRAEGFKGHAPQSNVGIVDVATKLNEVHVQLVLSLVDE